MITGVVPRAVGLALALFSASAVAAQQPQAAVVPEAITVGDVFRAAVRIDVPTGTQLAAPDSLPLPPDLEVAGRREARIDTAAGARRITLVYPLTAWRPGSYTLPPVDVQLVGDGTDRTLTVHFPDFTVRSVLPADTTGIQPRPAKDVLGASRLWWPILLALLIAAALATALWYWWRRRRRVEEAPALVVVPRVHPRTAALQALARLRDSDLLERGEVKRFHVLMTEALRHYVATLDARWGVDLTTVELAQRMAAAGATIDTVELVRILAAADLVKFARRRAAREESLRELAAAMAWVENAEPHAAAAGNEDRRVA